MGEGAKIATVNLKIDTYNSGKFKGAKSYTINQNEPKPFIVNQNGTKVTSLLGKVKQIFSRRGFHYQ